MNRLRVAVLALCAFAAFAMTSPSARAGGDIGTENCFTVRGEANARNQWVSKRRAEKRLAEKIAYHMRDPAGVSVGPTTFHCILRACEATAVVCHPY